MTEKAQVYNILIADEYETSNGEVKTSWTRAGVAFANPKGFNCEVKEGLALTGRFVILPRTARTTPEPQDDDIPL
jgi:hypothetical protein